MFSFNLDNIISSNLRALLKKGVLVALLNSLGKPLRTIHTNFINKKEEWYFRLAYNGQVQSLEELLNYLYDKEERIYIEDVLFQDDVYVGNETNRDQVYIQSWSSYDTIYLSVAPKYIGESNFIVNILIEIYDEFKKEEITKTIDTYKLAGKTYQIVEWEKFEEGKGVGEGKW